MAGMMAMSISTGTVSVLAAETDEVEGWEVVGTTSSCIPVSEYEGELDEYAPEDGYVLDVQFCEFRCERLLCVSHVYL